MFRKLIGISVALVCALATSAQTSKPRHAKLSLISEHATVAPGSSEWVGIRFELEPGWHIYWTNPGDSGEPPKMKWNLPDGIEAGALQFPAPKRIADHGMTDYGYEGNAVLLAKLTIPKTFTSNKAEIRGDLRYLVCREVCVPAREQLLLTVGIGKSGNDAPEMRVIVEARERLPQVLPRGVRAYALSHPNDFMIAVEGLRPGGGVFNDFLPSEPQVIENSDKPKAQPGVDQVTLTMKKSEQLNHPVSELHGLLLIGNTAYNVAIPVISSDKNSRTAAPRKGQSAKQISKE